MFTKVQALNIATNYLHQELLKMRFLKLAMRRKMQFSHHPQNLMASTLMRLNIQAIVFTIRVTVRDKKLPIWTVQDALVTFENRYLLYCGWTCFLIIENHIYVDY